MYILAADIGGTSIKYGVLDESGTIYEKMSLKTPKDDIEELIQQMKKVAQKFENIYDLDGIAMSCPGAVNNDSGFIGGVSAVPCIHGINIKAKIKDKLEFSKISMDNDANCAALAEVWKGAAKDYEDSAFFIIGSGIGGAVIRNKNIQRGTHLEAGEFGYMIISDDDEELSEVASTVNMVKKVENRKNISGLDGKKVFEMAENGDVIAKEEIKKFYRYIAVGIYNVQYICDPEVIVIGGGISERSDIIYNIEKALDDIIAKRPMNKIRPIIKKCKFKNDANLIGAVYNYNKTT
ncbi:MAG: ROK family protein [Clostridium sp.]|nr:ROK family protein [Clostridium sp.]